MLTKQEELRVASFIDSLKDDVNNGRKETDLTPKALLWLAEKLKETNDQWKTFKEQIDKLVDKSWEDHWKYNKEEDDAD